jgi:hypothetical protein
VSTRVEAMTAAHPYAKAGLMLRTGVDAGSGHVILDVKPDGYVEFMSRAADGSSTTYLRGAAIGYPAWLKLQRDGEVVTAYVHGADTDWMSLGSTTVSGLRFGGLAVTSHDPSTVNQATFSETVVGAGGTAASTASWSNRDIGSVGLSGSATIQQDGINVRAAGADIWGYADGFHYVYQPLRGSGLVARVAVLQGTHVFAKAGLMIRGSLAADSAHVILDVRPSGEIEFMSRSADGAETIYYTGSWMPFPGWLELRREGDSIAGYQSSDGVSWSRIGAIAAPWAADALGGVVVTSHDTTRLTQATFDNVAILP